MPAPLPPPGWYPDPVDPRRSRWWDGWTWTPSVVPTAGYGSVRAWADAAYAREVRMAPWARAATFVYPTLVAAIGLVNLATASEWRAYFHSLRVLFHSFGTPGPPPRLAPVPLWAEGFALFSLAAEAVFLIWQYRAATTARHLGYPAKRPPGLGVGSYFIPIVQLWFPYQALRDCLPPDSQHRRLVRQVWPLLIASSIANIALELLFAEVPHLGVALFGVSVVLEAFLAVLGYRMVQAITRTHRQAIAQP